MKAATRYTRIEQFGDRENGFVSLLSFFLYLPLQVSFLALSPLTHRRHQLLLHCRALQTPLIGDPLAPGSSTAHPQMMRVRSKKARHTLY